MRRVRHKDHGARSQQASITEERAEEVPTSWPIECRKDVIKEQEARQAVRSASKRDTLLLPTGQSYAALADDRVVGVR